MREEPRFSPYLGILVGVFSVSTASILIRLSSAPSLAIASYRLLFATLILLPPFLLRRSLRELRLPPRDLLRLVGVGVVLAAHFASWITSLSFTSVASSVILVNAAPIFVALISHLCLGERVTGRGWLGTIIAFIGSAIISLGDLGLGENNLLGDLLALVGAVMLALYLLAGRRIRQELGLLAYVTPVYAVSALTLLLSSLSAGVPLAPYPPRELLLFLALAVVPMIFGHTVYNWALRYVEAPIIAVSLLGEPLGAILLAALILGEIPHPIVALGGCLTLLGIYLTASS
ncbi:DMT family transporter [Candidatus Bathyarchaeota archaeon]|nr:DMT family transporter [Candidatus Bathyarchaeota archaeon]